MKTEILQKAIDKKQFNHLKTTSGLVEQEDGWIITGEQYDLKIPKSRKIGSERYFGPEGHKKLCEYELALNKELAGEIYLEVVPIHTSDIREVNPEQDAVTEYALKIKHTNRKDSLDGLLLSKRIPNNLAANLARRLVNFHMRSEVIKNTFNITRFQHKYEESKRAEFFVKDLLGYAHFSILLKGMDAAKKFLSDNRYYLQERTITGMIRNGHGNITAKNVFPGQEISITNRELKQSGRRADVLFDIARLGIDIDFHGAYDFSNDFIQHYFKFSEEEKTDKAMKLYAFYKLFQTNRNIIQIIDNTTLYTFDSTAKNRLSRYFSLMTKYLKILQ